MQPTSQCHPGFNPGSRNKKQKNTNFFLFFFWIPAFAGMTVWRAFSSPVLAVGISISPPELHLNGSPDKKITSSFTVSNPSRETVVYEVTNDGLLSLIITPTTFLLKPNESSHVTVEYQPTNDPLLAKEGLEGRSQTTLSILGRPLTVNPTQAASGIKLPVSISIGQIEGASARQFDRITLGIIILDSALGALLLFILARRIHITRGKFNSHLPRP